MERAKKKIYLDYNATTPVHPEVKEAVMPYLQEEYGNPSSVHIAGRVARKAVEIAREQVAALLGCMPSEVVFTSSGTEANNMAVKGALKILRREGKKHIVTTAVEHASVYETCRYLEKEGFEVTYITPYRDGYIDEEKILSSIRENTALVSVMHVNNETGVVYPVERIGKALQKFGILFHVDAVQSAGKIPISVRKIRAHFISISGHKLYALKGAGALYIKKGTLLEPLLHGGHQERGLRAGTLAVPAIVGLGKACEIALRDMEEVRHHVESLGRLMAGKLLQIPGSRINGDSPTRFPGVINISFEGVDGEALTMALDLAGVMISTGSACASGTPEPSRVLIAMGLSRKDAASAIRISIGRFTTREDVEEASATIARIVDKLRKKQPVP